MNEADYRKLISGQSRGLGSAVMRGGLAMLSPGYQWGVRFRNFCYDRGFRSTHRADVPVISVGNLTTGGTGKTPIVCWMAQWFSDQSIAVAILSRGYRTIDGQENDEKRLLDLLCPHVPHLQNPDRVASARLACAEYASRALILDDGFQHRRLARDLDCVLIDALNPWGYGRLLPRGLLREPIASLQRADVVLITRADQISSTERTGLQDHIKQHAPAAAIVEVVFPPQRLVNCSQESVALESLRGRRVAAFCGIGNPDGFRRLLVDADLKIAGFREFADHYRYAPNDIAELEAWARDIRADAVVTTQKDLVKFDRSVLAGSPLWAVQIGVEFINGQDLLEQRLQPVLNRCRQSLTNPGEQRAA